MVLEIDGVNILPYVAPRGFNWQRNDIDASDTGRTLDGKLRRKRVTTKIRLDITCRPLTTEEAAVVLSAIMPEFVTVRYTDPQVGSVVEKTMYANNNPASVAVVKNAGTPLEVTWWDGITFPLIEQ